MEIPDRTGDDVLPRHDIELDPTLPDRFGFWVPTDDEVQDAEDAESGIGYFHDTWLLGQVEHDEADHLVKWEADLISTTDALARDDKEFELIAVALEWGNPEDIENSAMSQRPVWAALEEAFPDETGFCPGLELGVAGLSYALAAVGLVPVASCRSHAEPHSWSDSPVVFVATDRPRATVLERLAAEHGCGLDCDDVNRPQFLIVTAHDIRAMNGLAAAVLAAADQFGPGSVVVPAR